MSDRRAGADGRALEQIVERNQVWPAMAAKYGVENPVPPWKTSLDGLCDALDQASCDADVPDFKERARRGGRAVGDRLLRPALPGEPAGLAGALADGPRRHHRIRTATTAFGIRERLEA